MLPNASWVKEFFQNVSTVLFKLYATDTRTLCSMTTVQKYAKAEQDIVVLQYMKRHVCPAL